MKLNTSQSKQIKELAGINLEGAIHENALLLAKLPFLYFINKIGVMFPQEVFPKMVPYIICKQYL